MDIEIIGSHRDTQIFINGVELFDRNEMYDIISSIGKEREFDCGENIDGTYLIKG